MDDVSRGRGPFVGGQSVPVQTMAALILLKGLPNIFSSMIFMQTIITEA
jgi:hypothetical protein